MISVIIPSYNAEKYIDRMFNCLLRQTYTDFEAIFVNDGSTDKTKEIIDGLCLRDSRIKALHCKHGGLASVRNAGLKVVKGEYITFIDVDDELKDDYFERLITPMIGDSSIDVVASSICVVKDGVATEYKEDKDIVLESKQYLDDYFDPHIERAPGKLYCIVAWGKLFKKELLEGLFYDETLRYTEDKMFNMHVYVKIPKILKISYCGYYYIINQQSLMTGRQDNKKRENYKYVSSKAEVNIYKLVKENGIDIEGVNNFELFYSSSAPRILRTLAIYDKAFYYENNKTLKEIAILGLKNNSGKRKALIKLFLKCPKTFRGVIKSANKISSIFKK